MEVHNNMVQLKPGAMILYEPNAKHYYHNPRKGFDNDWFHFNAEYFYAFSKEIGLPLNTPFYIHDVPMVHTQIQSIEKEYLLKELGYQVQINNMISSFFLLLSRAYNSHDTHGNQPHFIALENLFREIRSTVLSSLSKEWTVDGMANMSGLSRSRFTYLYKSFFRISPKDDLISERFNMARHLLTSTNQNVTQIAKKVGYENIYHFCKQFKKITAMSPSSYRDTKPK
jgi:AraC-like DNA-binding protein